MEGKPLSALAELTEFGNGAIIALAMGPQGVVVFGNQFPAIPDVGESPTLDWNKVWYAPLTALE